MSIRVKRTLFLVHRWTGVAMCVLMTLWFVSGIVMLFVGYPKLTPPERLAALPALSQCRIDPAAALQASGVRDASTLALTTIGGVPHFVASDAGGRPIAVDARTGSRRTAVDSAAALAAARAFAPGAAARHAGTVEIDRWTLSRTLNPHRPLHVVELADARATRVYVSSATGQVVLDAARGERYWNVAGAWLHWLYMFKSRPADPVWSWTVIGLADIGVLTSVTGIVNGLSRWRFRGRYKHGGRTPYRAGALRWHHLLGLTFGAVLCTWIFSGLMSMNPGGLFDARGATPDAAAMRGGSPASARLPVAVSEILDVLARQRFAARELEWRVLDGEPFVLARDGANDTRIVRSVDGALVVAAAWPEHVLRHAVARTLPSPIVATERLAVHDAYYYRRDEASMYGANERRLPVLRVAFGDAAATWAYVDMRTGQLELTADRAQRAGRWLFNLLHSWDVPALLDSGWLRVAALLALSAGGLLLSGTAVEIGWRRVRRA